MAADNKKPHSMDDFLDGLFDIIVLGILHIIFYEIIKNEGKIFPYLFLLIDFGSFANSTFNYR